MKTYLPAAGHDLFLPLYDPLTRLIGVDRDRRALVAGADLLPGHRVLDLGCGTGTLVVTLATSHPGVEVTGVDPDPKALARARKKAARAGVRVRLDRGFADALPYDDATFDRVLSSFMIHHLEPADKAAAFAEIRRVLRPGGRFELLDFGGAHDHDGGLLRRLLHSSSQLADNGEASLLERMHEAGLSDAQVVDRRTGLFGRVVRYRARREA